MNIIRFTKKIGMLIGNAERLFFHIVVRGLSRIVERVTGFNNFDQAMALVVGLLAALLLAASIISGDAARKFWNNAISDGSVIWMTIGVILFLFSAEYIIKMCIHRRRAFFDSALKETIMRSYSTDRFALAILSVQTAIAANHFDRIEVKVAAVTVSMLYVALGLAKTEPRFDLQNQERRVAPLFCMLGLTCTLVLAIIFGLCFHMLPGLSVLVMLGALVLALIIIHMIGNIEGRIRSVYRVDDAQDD